ncbi:hypothetical protein HBI22_193880 [Parastagonospora nodorum]|nr:hypothetical protein HBI28_170790 [Parastagonospora nodorum]KAH5621527.1 hypothetical protein HBI22_193880 [Parastagonospora nodorum]
MLKKLMTPKQHTLQYLAPRTLLHRPRPTKITTTTLHLNNIKLKAALTLTPDNCRTN